MVPGIEYNGKVYSINEFIHNESIPLQHRNQFISAWNEFDKRLSNYIRTSDQFRSITIPREEDVPE